MVVAVICNVLAACGRYDNERAWINAVWSIIVGAIYVPLFRNTQVMVDHACSACEQNDEKELDAMFETLRYVSKYVGICSIATIAIFVVAIIGAVLLGINS